MLRDYQIEMKSRLMEAWKAHRSVMVQMPTGTGKTHLLASVVSEFVSSAGSGVWLIAHRRELVAQMEETLAKALLESPAKMQTGPAIRGDMDSMLRHLEGLRAHPEWRDLYIGLSKSINPGIEFPREKRAKKS